LLLLCVFLFEHNGLWDEYSCATRLHCFCFLIREVFGLVVRSQSR
jgi:hypothetical protein